MNEPTITAHPIEPTLRDRKSSRAFAPRSVTATDLRALFEAARWAPSSFNEQPWRFVVARRAEEPAAFERLLGTLSEKNQRWAGAAPLLVTTLARRAFTPDDRPNRHALHDLGAATAQLTVEATARGLGVHPMAGFDAARVREVLSVPDDFEVVAVLAVGHPGEDGALPDDLQGREKAPRRRRPQSELVFAATFGEPLATDQDYEEVLWRWFGPLDGGRSLPSYAARWYRKDAAFDELLRRELGAVHAAVAQGAHEAWRATPRGRLAYVIVLDQLSRNLFRDTPAMYAHDARALEIAREALAAGDDDVLARDERGFLYMPLPHSEELAYQERCVALFTRMRDASEGPDRDQLENSRRYAVMHRDIVARFGRFPHRNAILGRSSTPEELEFLKEPGSSF
jgi:uncharacterized protein (DUF924 family)/nitroreductase